MKALVAVALVTSGWLLARSEPEPEPTQNRIAQQVRTLAPPRRIGLDRIEAREAMATGRFAMPVATILNVGSPLHHGEFRWDEAGVPPGRIWISIDLHQQLISVFRGGHEIGTAVILYGADSNETPTGTFPILAKLKSHHSAVYDGASMPYTLRLTSDGVSIHGSNVRNGYATHGCIGVPVDFAAKLYAAASKGDEVIIVAGK